MEACPAGEKEGQLGVGHWVLVHQIWARYVMRCREVDLPKSLLEEPLLCVIFGNFCSLG